MSEEKEKGKLRVLLKNFKGFKEAKYEFDDTGLVQVTGANSNGKSILHNAIAFIARKEFLSPKMRDTNIHWGENEAIIAIEYRGKMLIAKICREADECVFKLIREDGESVIRHIREGVGPLIEEFGLATYNKDDICLQVFETHRAIPFAGSTPATLYEIIDDITTDKNAQAFLENYSTVTHKRLKEHINSYNERIKSLNSSINMVVVDDYEKLEAFVTKAEGLADILRKLKPVKIIKSKVLPKMNIIPWQAGKLIKTPYVKVYTTAELINAKQLITNINIIKEGRCPTCLREWR